jgi:hypothetical protein
MTHHSVYMYFCYTAHYIQIQLIQGITFCHIASDKLLNGMSQCYVQVGYLATDRSIQTLDILLMPGSHSVTIVTSG